MKKTFLLLLFVIPLFAVAQSNLELPYGIKVLNPKPLDAYYYNTSGAPYTSTSQVTTQVIAGVRYKGQTFNINGIEYWFGNGIADADLVAKAGGGGSVLSVTGTANKITSTGGNTPVLDIASTYSGQTSITTLGTIATGTWNASTIGVNKGGTGKTSLTAYAPLFGGTTTTGAIQSGTAGSADQVMFSNGPAALPTFNSGFINLRTGTGTLANDVIIDGNNHDFNIGSDGSPGEFANINFVANGSFKRHVFSASDDFNEEINPDAWNVGIGDGTVFGGYYYSSQYVFGSRGYEATVNRTTGISSPYFNTRFSALTDSIQLIHEHTNDGNVFTRTYFSLKKLADSRNAANIVAGSDYNDFNGIVYDHPDNIVYTDSTLITKGWFDAHGGTGTGITSISTSSPLTGGPITSTGTIGIANSAADGTTKGAATFTANDFNSSSGVISLDYVNAQTASGSNKGFLSSTDWTTFNNKPNNGALNTQIPMSDGTNFVSSGYSIAGSNFLVSSLDAGMFAGAGTSGHNNGYSSSFSAGDGYATSGNGIGGNLQLQSGTGHGTGSDGNVSINAKRGTFTLSNYSSAIYTDPNVIQIHHTGTNSTAIDFDDSNIQVETYDAGSVNLSSIVTNPTNVTITTSVSSVDKTKLVISSANNATVFTDARSSATGIQYAGDYSGAYTSRSLVDRDYVDKRKKYFPIACSDLTTSLTTGTTKAYFRIPTGLTVTGVRASLLTAQSSGSLITIDINENGTSILSTKLTIDNSEKTSTTAATAAVISDTSLADDSEITFDIDAIGTGGLGLIVEIIGY